MREQVLMTSATLLIVRSLCIHTILVYWKITRQILHGTFSQRHGCWHVHALLLKILRTSVRLAIREGGFQR